MNEIAEHQNRVVGDGVEAGHPKNDRPDVVALESGPAPPPPWADGLVLVDPGWRPASDNEPPPVAHIVGIWPIEADGSAGKFRANPDFQPTDENSPSDPLDAVLRLLARGQATSAELEQMLRNTLFDVAVDAAGHPIRTGPADGLPHVVVASGAPHRARVVAARWRRMDLAALVAMLTDEVPVLFNPSGPAPLQLTTEHLRATLSRGDGSLSTSERRNRGNR